LVELLTRENLKFANNEIIEIKQIAISANKLNNIFKKYDFNTEDNKELVKEIAFWVKNEAKGLWELSYLLSKITAPHNQHQRF